MPDFPVPLPGTRRLWQNDGAALDQADDDLRSRILTVRIVGSGSPFDVFFHLEPSEGTDLEQLVRRVRERPGCYQSRRPQVDPPRTLVGVAWASDDGKDRVDVDDCGDSWMTAEVRLGITVYSVQFRLTPGEAARSEATAQAAKASPRVYEIRPPRLRRPGDPKILWSDACGQWSLEEDAAGVVWMSVSVYEGFGASLARIRMSDADAARCRAGWEASRRLADTIARARGRYP